jgi:holo-[acyl-carrier protein] synthase
MITGCGVDIVEVRRIREAVKKWGDDFLKRIFTSRELQISRNKPSLYEYLAGRFAAKEAISKAFGTKDITFKDIEIINNETGKPTCILLKNKEDNLDIHISISHIKNYAVATAIITKKT